MRRAARVVVVALAFVAAMAGVLLGDLFYRPLPTRSGHYRFLGLHQQAEVVRDDLGTAHVYARDLHDLYFLQGYVTAQDRLAQMDALRVEARSRLGATAQQQVARASPALRDALDAYAQGVSKLISQYADARALPGELVLAGRDPPAWEAADSLAVASWYLELLRPRSVCAIAPAARTLKGMPILAADLYDDMPKPGWYEIGIAGGDVHAVGVSLPGVPGIVAGHNGWVAWALAPSVRPGPDPVATVDGILQGSTAVSASGFTSAMFRSAVAACVADLQGHAGATERGRTAIVPVDRAAIIGGPARAAALTAPLGEARGIDTEAMRLLLGVPPAGSTGARLIVDLAEVDTSKLVLSEGVSGQRASPHYRDQAPLWEIGAERALPFSRAAMRPEGDLVLRPD
ncbi:MAG: penicillin acylase family protein [Chloroflexota bacterium]|nr:penicillin acylase family protein [Chloroflexota bacterium]MDE3192361.1 penicillin acylase family protein [Chloroflexota bacterium]